MGRSPIRQRFGRPPRLPNVAKIDRKGEVYTGQEVQKSRGLFQFKDWKGRPYVASWPRRRGTPKSRLQMAWVNHFSCLARLSKTPDPQTLANATAVAKDSGWYYRDIIESAANGKLWRYRGEIKVTTPTARVLKLASEPVAGDNALHPLTADAIIWDNNVFWDAANPTRLSIRSAGLYLMGGNVTWTAVSGGYRVAQIRLNGSTFVAQTTPLIPSAITPAQETMSLYYLSVGDYIELCVQTGTAGLNARMLGFWLVGITPEAII